MTSVGGGGAVQLTGCPECAAPAEVIEGGTVSGTAGPVPLVRIGCVCRHWFLMPRDSLPPASLPPARPAPAIRAGRGGGGGPHRGPRNPTGITGGRPARPRPGGEPGS
jgi:hypothetical protein